MSAISTFPFDDDDDNDTSGMDAPCPCTHCNTWFDLHSGFGSEKWYPGVVICKKCHREEEAEIENDEKIEELLNELSDAIFDLKETKQLIEGHTAELLKLGVKVDSEGKRID